MSRDKQNLEEIKSYDDSYWLRYLAENTIFDTENIKAQKDWLIKQLEAEKERVDKLEMILKATEGLTRAETKRADGWREHVRKLNIDLEYAEARERKLREALEQAQYHLNREQYMTAESAVEDALSLYSKEETK
jgi:fructose/tagatose bisphosphate aldolase